MEAGTMYAARMAGQPVRASRFHWYRDCGTIRGRTGEEVTVEEVNERERDLLGLRECTQCRNRRTGGPAIEALQEIANDPEVSGFTESHLESERVAWAIYNGLKERGFYIAQRKS